MPQVQMPDGTVVDMPDKLDPALGARLRAFQSRQSAPATGYPAPPPPTPAMNVVGAGGDPNYQPKPQPEYNPFEDMTNTAAGDVRDVARAPIAAAQSVIHGIPRSVGNAVRMAGEVAKATHLDTTMAGNDPDGLYQNPQALIDVGQDVAGFHKQAAQAEDQYTQKKTGISPNTGLGSVSGGVGDAAGVLAKASVLGLFALPALVAQGMADRSAAVMDDTNDLEKAVKAGAVDGAVNAAIMTIPSGPAAYKTLSGLIAAHAAGGAWKGSLSAAAENYISENILGQQLTPEQKAERYTNAIKLMLGWEAFGALGKISPQRQAATVAKAYDSPDSATSDLTADLALKQQALGRVITENNLTPQDILKGKSEPAQIAKDLRASIAKTQGYLAGIDYAQKSNMRWTGKGIAAPDSVAANIGGEGGTSFSEINPPDPMRPGDVTPAGDSTNSSVDRMRPPAVLTDAQKAELLKRGFPGEGKVKQSITSEMTPQEFVDGLEPNEPPPSASGPSPEAQEQVRKAYVPYAEELSRQDRVVNSPLPDVQAPPTPKDVSDRAEAAGKALTQAQGELDLAAKRRQDVLDANQDDLNLAHLDPKTLTPEEGSRLAQAKLKLDEATRIQQASTKRILKGLRAGEMPIDLNSSDDVSKYAAMSKNDPRFWEAKFFKPDGETNALQEQGAGSEVSRTREAGQDQAGGGEGVRPNLEGSETAGADSAQGRSQIPQTGADQDVADRSSGTKLTAAGLDPIRAVGELMGLKPDAPKMDVVREVMERIKGLGKTVAETALRIMQNVKGIARDAATSLAEHLHETFSGSAESQRGAIGRNVNPDSYTPWMPTKLDSGDAAKSPPPEPSKAPNLSDPKIAPEDRSTPLVDERKDMLRSLVKPLHPGEDTESKLIRKAIYGELDKITSPTVADAKRVAIDLGLSPDEAAPKLLTAAVRAKAFSQAAQGVLDTLGHNLANGFRGAVMEPVDASKRLLKGEGGDALQAFHKSIDDIGLVQHSYKKGSAIHAPIAESGIMGQAPKPIRDMPANITDGIRGFLQSPHIMEGPYFPDRFGPTVDRQIADTHQVRVGGELTRYFADILDQFKVADASGRIKDAMAPVFRKFIDASVALKPLDDQTSSYTKELSKHDAKIDALGKKLDKNPADGDVLDALGDEYTKRGQVKSLLDEHLANNGDKIRRLKGTIDLANAQRASFTRRFAKSDSDTRIYLAAEMKPDAIEPWLAAILSPREVKAADSIRDTMRDIRQHLGQNRIGTLADNEEYMTRIVRTLYPEYFSGQANNNTIPPEVLNFHNRMAGSKSWLPSLNAVADYYPHAAARKIAQQPFLDKWRGTADKNDPNGYANPASPNYNPGAAQYMGNMLQEMQNPPQRTLLDRCVDAARTYENWKLLATSLSTAYKHLYKMSAVLGAQHVYSVPALKAEILQNPAIRYAANKLGVETGDYDRLSDLKDYFVVSRQLQAGLEETNLKAAANTENFNGLMSRAGAAIAPRGGAVDKASGVAGVALRQIKSNPVAMVESLENGINIFSSIMAGEMHDAQTADTIRQTILNMLDFNQRGQSDAPKFSKNSLARGVVMFAQTPSKIVENYYQVAKAGAVGGKDVFGGDHTAKLIRMIATIGGAAILGSQLGFNAIDSVFHIPFINKEWWFKVGKWALAKATSDDEEADRQGLGMLGDQEGPFSTSPALDIGKDIAGTFATRDPMFAIKQSTAYKQLKAVNGDIPGGYDSFMSWVTKTQIEEAKQRFEGLAVKAGGKKTKEYYRKNR